MSAFTLGYSVLIRCKDGRKFLAHGGDGIPFFTTRWKDAHVHRRALKEHDLNGKVVKAKAAVVAL